MWFGWVGPPLPSSNQGWESSMWFEANSSPSTNHSRRLGLKPALVPFTSLHAGYAEPAGAVHEPGWPILHVAPWGMTQFCVPQRKITFSLYALTNSASVIVFTALQPAHWHDTGPLRPSVEFSEDAARK